MLSIWIDGTEKCFVNGSFVADLEWTPILFKQLDYDVSGKSSDRIKRIILNSIIYNGNNGRIDLISEYALQYLSTNEAIARAVFNTIIKLAEDNCGDQTDTIGNTKSILMFEDFEFEPNVQTDMQSGEYHTDNENQTKSESKKESIIEQYLIKECPFELGQFDISKYDINMLCNISNCGLPLTDKNCSIVMRQIILFLIDLWHEHTRRYETHSIVGYHEELKVKKKLQTELLLGDDAFEAVISILFDGIDFSRFSSTTIDFYLDQIADLSAIACQVYRLH